MRLTVTLSMAGSLVSFAFNAPRFRENRLVRSGRSWSIEQICSFLLVQNPFLFPLIRTSASVKRGLPSNMFTDIFQMKSTDPASSRRIIPIASQIHTDFFFID